SRRTVDLQEASGSISQADADLVCAVLVVEPLDGDWLSGGLNELLRGKEGFAFFNVGSGGEALDLASRRRFQIMLICDTLPDLPDTMVSSTCKTQSPQTSRNLHSRPGVRAGKAEIHDGSRIIPLLPEFSEVRQIVARLDELREAARRTSRE